MNPIETEPVVTLIGGVTGLTNAGMALATAFGVNLTPGQMIAINSFVLAIMVLIARRRVTPA